MTDLPSKACCQVLRIYDIGFTAGTAQAIRKGATKQEIMEAIWVAAEMRAGAAYAHAALAIDEIEAVQQ